MRQFPPILAAHSLWGLPLSAEDSEAARQSPSCRIAAHLTCTPYSNRSLLVTRYEQVKGLAPVGLKISMPAGVLISSICFTCLLERTRKEADVKSHLADPSSIEPTGNKHCQGVPRDAAPAHGRLPCQPTNGLVALDPCQRLPAANLQCCQ